MSKSILKSTLQLTLFSIIGIVFGFLNQLVLASYFGTSGDRDAYFAANVIPTYIVAVFIGSIGAIFLSNYINVKSESEEGGAKFLSASLCFCLVGLSLIAVLGIFFSEKILRLSAPGFSGSQLIEASTILKILFPTIVFQGLINILTSVYQSKSKFLFPSFPAIITPVVSIILLVILKPQLGIVGLAWGNLLGYFISFLLLMFPFLKRNGDLYFLFAIRNKNLKKLLILSLPLLASGIIFRFNTVWERILASKLPTGSISYLGYSNQILLLLSTVTTGGIATIFFPLLSKMWYDNDMLALKLCFQKGIRILLFVTLPSIFLLILLRVNVVHIIFQRGAFNQSSTNAVSNAIAIMMGAYFFQSLGSLVFRAFYFMNKTVMASVIGIIEIGFYILFSTILIKNFSYLGLAMALSLSAGCNMTMTTFFVNKSVKFIDKSLILSFFKLILSCTIALFIVYYLKTIPFTINILLVTAFYTLIYCIIYVLMTYILKIEETLMFLQKIKNYFTK